MHIRENTNADSRAVGVLDLGQSLPAADTAERGAPYHFCGGSEWWIPVPYEGSTCYVPLTCVEWLDH